MTPLPLGEIRLRLRDHRSALWWVGLLYRRPARFCDAVEECSIRERFLAIPCLLVHVFLYMFLISIAARWLFWSTGFSTDLPGRPDDWTALSVQLRRLSAALSSASWSRDAATIALREATRTAASIVGEVGILNIREIFSGLLIGVAFAVGVGWSGGVTGGLAFGISTGIIGGIGFHKTPDPLSALPDSILLGCAMGFATGVAMALALRRNVGIARAIVATLSAAFVQFVQSPDFMMSRGIMTITDSLVLLTAAIFGIWQLRRPQDSGRLAALGAVQLMLLGYATNGIAYGLLGAALYVVVLLRLYYYPAHLVFLWPEVLGRWYPRHPVAWDDMCLVPFLELDWLLVAYAEVDQKAAEAEIDRLIANYPAQRDEALGARATLIARQAGQASDLTTLDDVVSRLPEGARGFLGDVPRLREMIHDVVLQQARLDTIDRPAFRELTARLLCKEIEAFQYRLDGFHEPLRSDFGSASARWLEVAQQQLLQAQAIVEREPTPQVFRAGDPVEREKEAFVPRHGVFGELERQVMLSSGCPGIVLYGRRRVGKSTVLRNLSGYLPTSVLPVTISMQDPQAFTSLELFMNLVATRIREKLPAGSVPDRVEPTLPRFFDFLTACDEALRRNDRRLLLCLDEYENLDKKIGDGVFPADLLAVFRESIQSHRKTTWVFAGSHEITELDHAPWTSYLVSARTIEVPLFNEAETRLLLTEPLQQSTLWPKDDPQRPRPHFSNDFWGEGGIDRIHAEAGGWPHLVQLIAETVVDLLNEEGSLRVNETLREKALDRAIVRGHNVLYELMDRESRLPGEWDYLSAFRGRDVQPPPADEPVARSLRRRLLVVEEGGQWRIRVPLMLRWLRARG